MINKYISLLTQTELTASNISNIESYINNKYDDWQELVDALRSDEVRHSINAEKLAEFELHTFCCNSQQQKI